jgi:hypothetical protein
MTDDQPRPGAWGGPRAGSGRPPLPPEERPVDLNVKVTPALRDWVDRVGKTAGDKSRAVTVARILTEARRVQALREVLVELAAGGEDVNAQWVLDVLDGNVTPTETSPTP